MAYDLAGIVKRTNPRRRSVAARPVVPTKTREDALASIYLEVVRGWQTAIREQILPAYEQSVAVLTRDDDPVAIGLAAILRVVAEQMGRVVVSLRPRALRWLTEFGGWHTNRFAQTIQAAAGVDVRHIMSPTEIAQTIDIALERNVALISSVNEQTQSKVVERIWAGISQQMPRDEMAKELAQVIGTSRARARRIATDQTAKMGAALDEIRQKEAGLDEYMWRHSRKLHPRDWHRARDGKVFDWKDIPANDMPGVPPFCGCKKQPYLNLD
jgi:SPP1 gp7 family putative phage head morphogenesis protein